MVETESDWVLCFHWICIIKYLKECKIAFRCRSLVYKGIYFNIKKYLYNTSCESQKTNQSELFCFP